VFIIFFIASIAETNRAPFDLAEAESELVSGFMTEHSAVIFVFFFLAEYASILLICVLNSILFIGGYLFNPFILDNIFQYIDYFVYNMISPINNEISSESISNFYNSISISMLDGLTDSTVLATKTAILVFTFI
jgi:NADH-ubiquinone oxidoreductase chain 1